MSDLILFWHRRDLRTSDNIGLAAARQQSSKVVGVFCLDPDILKRDDVAPARVTYMMGSLRLLQEQYAQAGSQLLIIQGQPVTAIPALAQALNAKSVVCNRDVEPYARNRDRTVRDALKQIGIPIQAFWDQLLHSPKEIMTGSGQPYTVFTPFWRNWNAKAKQTPVEKLYNAEGLSELEQQAARSVGAIALPSAKDLGFVWDNPLLLEPGEQPAFERLEEFCEQNAIAEYGEQRDFPASYGTSQLSAAFKFGTLGIRTAWAKANAVYQRSRSDEARDSVQTWQQELAWREFYQHAMYFFPQLADGPYRVPFKNFPWVNHEGHFEAWCAGQTGYPIVDAAMRQMNELGWMHNRCRMIVANFLVKDLIINWQEGEKYFMQKLFDGDLSSNNGGWQWSASSGMDPKPLRIFNPASQAKKYDPDAEYIRQWLPELRSVDTEYLVTGEIPNDERDRCGYPRPIVNHKIQQNLFKQLYSQQKAIHA